MQEEIKAEEAAFKFNSYKISSFSFNDPKEEPDGVYLDIVPSGLYIEERRRFLLILAFKALYKDDKEAPIEITSCILESAFTFKEAVTLEQIPEYFYVNSIAILFPYLRSFISTLTHLANIRVMTLPIMRLDMFGHELRENTKKWSGSNEDSKDAE